MGKLPAADLQRPSNIREATFRMFIQIIGEPGRGPFERRGSLGGDDQQLRGSRRCCRRRCRSFLEYDMGVRSTDPERTDAGPARSAVRYPRSTLGACHERRAVKIELRVGTGEVNERR